MQKSRFVICNIYALFPAELYLEFAGTQNFSSDEGKGLYIYIFIHIYIYVYLLKPELLAIRIIQKDMGLSQIHGISH